MSKPKRSLESERIGKNIKAIKDANGMTWEEFADFVKVSLSTLTKLKGGSIPFSDDDLSKVALKTGISEKEIKEIDPELFAEKHGFYKNSKVISDNVSIYKMLISDFTPSFMEAMFPFETDKKSLSTKSFSDAIKMSCQTDDDLLEAIKLFHKSLDEGATPAACVNILSCLFLYFLFFTNGYKTGDDCMEVLNKSAKSRMMVSKILKDSSNKDLAKKRKKLFFETYSGLIEECFEKTTKSRRYREYAQFNYAIRDVYGMLDYETETSDEEVAIKFLSEFSLLYQTRNKYAIRFIDSLPKN